jgi:hypothetical protein
MNAIVKTESKALSAEAMEHVLGTGDLSKLTVIQRVEYYGHVCRSLGLNPLTRPFRFMSFQGQTVLYATRDCTDQLRSTRKISVSIVDKQMDGDLFIVTARAETPDHRRDEDVGAVTMGQLKGDARANAIMKAMTKAKRRVTMSICGMGFLDESEVETLHGAKTYDADEEQPVAQIHSPAPPVNDPPPERAKTPNETKRRTAREWLDNLALNLSAAQTVADIDAIATSNDVVKITALWAPENNNGDAAKNQRIADNLRNLNALLSEAIARIRTPHDPETGEIDDTFPGDRP